MTDKNIFRQASLDRLSSPEQLDQLMQVTHPRGWLALIGLGILLVAAVLWGFYSTVSTTVMGQGMIIKTGGVRNVVSTIAGQIININVKTGDNVEKGQRIATLFRWDTDSQATNQVSYLNSAYSGRVIEVKAETGVFIERGALIAAIESLDSALEAVLYVSSADGKKVQPGMDVQIAPSTIKPEEYGYILGTVKSVSSFPVSKEGVQIILGSKELTDKFFETGPPHEIRVILHTDINTPSGYKWSSQGPDISVDSGTFSSAKIIIRRQNPISIVIPILKKRLGVYTGPSFDEK
jgi:multidrug efflux pump subunit AcrA (membrane-fusion protein)